MMHKLNLFEYLFESGKKEVSFLKSKHYKVVSIYLVDVSRMTFKVNWCRNSCIQKVFISSFARKEDVCIIRVKWPVILRRKLIICVRLKKLIARKIRCVNETNMLQNTFIVLYQEVYEFRGFHLTWILTIIDYSLKIFWEICHTGKCESP